jgi:hypothetical protein
MKSTYCAHSAQPGLLLPWSDRETQVHHSPCFGELLVRFTDRFSASRSAAVRRMAALLTLATAAACSDGVTDGQPGTPGGGTPPDNTPVVASVEITPGTLQLPVEGSRALSATVRTHNGAVLTGRLVSWSSSDPQVVRVDDNGNATALKVGTAVISAAAEGRQGQSTIEVVAPPAPPAVASVLVLGEEADLEPGQTRLLAVQLRAASGEVLYGRDVAWSSSDSTVIKAFPGGQVLGLKGGTATITATSEGKSGSLTIVIPQWLTYDLQSVDAGALPALLTTTADTTERTELVTVVRERRVVVTAGRLWTSTTDMRYRQRYDLQTWERTASYFSNGETIATQAQLVDARTIRDEGAATMYDVWTGGPIYESQTFAGHSFRVQATVNHGRRIIQQLPGEGGKAYDLRFAK